MSWTRLAEGERVMTAGDALVCVVEEDAPRRASLTHRLRSVGLRVAAFAAAQEFLRSPRPEGPSCLVLDVRLLVLWRRPTWPCRFRSPRRPLWGTPHDGGVHARLLPEVRGPPQAGAGRANALIPAPYHCNTSGFDVVLEAGVWL